jgi:hypothetical protein
LEEVEVFFFCPYLFPCWDLYVFEVKEISVYGEESIYALLD